MVEKTVLISESAISSNTEIVSRKSEVLEFVAVLQEADAPNRNGRIYPKAALERALNSPAVQERLRNKSFFVEAGHPPADASLSRQTTVDPLNIAAIIKEIWWEGNLLKGRLETANTSIGRDMKGLIEQGSRVAFSLRAQGAVSRDPLTGKTIIKDPIHIVTYDWVVTPSHDKAYLESISESTKDYLLFRSGVQTLTESIDLYNNGRLIEIENEEIVMEDIDLLKYSYQKVKDASQVYFYSPEDTAILTPEYAIVESVERAKRIKTTPSDYVLKDIRHKIKNL